MAVSTSDLMHPDNSLRSTLHPFLRSPPFYERLELPTFEFERVICDFTVPRWPACVLEDETRRLIASVTCRGKIEVKQRRFKGNERMYRRLELAETRLERFNGACMRDWHPRVPRRSYSSRRMEG